ncbi:MAG: glycosyltransferase, partial [Bacteroidota bacterium]
MSTRKEWQKISKQKTKKPKNMINTAKQYKEKPNSSIDRPKITVIIHTLNEEKHIGDCIRSVENFANEVLVCDMYSEDQTVEIAESLGAKIMFHERLRYADPARLAAIREAKHEWVFRLDADERMTPSLAEYLM